MKSLKEVRRNKTENLESVNLRKERKGTRVVVGMGTCGIAAGARPVLLAFVEEVKKRNLTKCNCNSNRLYRRMPFRTYGRGIPSWRREGNVRKMTPEKVKRVVSRAYRKRSVVTEYTIGAEEK